MSDDLAAQLVPAVVKAIAAKVDEVRNHRVIGSQPGDVQIARAAVLAMLHEIRSERILFIYEGHLGPHHTPQPAALANRIEQGDGK